MRMLFGTYSLDMNCRELDVLLQRTIANEQEKSTTPMTGLRAVPLSVFLKSTETGFTLITDDENKSVVGMGAKTRDLSRVYVVPTADHKHVIYFDGYPTMANEVGLFYEESTGNIISPLLDNKIILEGKAYQ